MKSRIVSFLNKESCVEKSTTHFKVDMLYQVVRKRTPGGGQNIWDQSKQTCSTLSPRGEATSSAAAASAGAGVVGGAAVVAAEACKLDWCSDEDLRLSKQRFNR